MTAGNLPNSSLLQHESSGIPSYENTTMHDASEWSIGVQRLPQSNRTLARRPASVSGGSQNPDVGLSPLWFLRLAIIQRSTAHSIPENSVMEQQSCNIRWHLWLMLRVEDWMESFELRFLPVILNSFCRLFCRRNASSVALAETWPVPVREQHFSWPVIPPGILKKT